MKELIEKVKALPFTVKIAMGVLFAIWCLACLAFPAGMLLFTIVVAALGSCFRIFLYLVDGQ